MKKRRWLWLVAGLFFLFVIVIFVQGGRAALRAQLEAAGQVETHTVARGDLRTEVVESGRLESTTFVEVKSRVSGRVVQLLVDEGDRVQAGQLIAVIEPEETQLQVSQSQAQLRGAESAVQRTRIEIEQRRLTARTGLDRAERRVAQLEREVEAQPQLSQASIESAESSLRSAEQSLRLLTEVTHPNARIQVDREVSDAEASLKNAEAELDRQRGLLDRGFISQREFETAELNLELARTRRLQAQQRADRLAEEQRLEEARSRESLQQARNELERARLGRVQDRAKEEELARARADLADARTSLRDVEAAEAGLRQQMASVEQIRTQLSDNLRLLGETEIRAPIDGVITRRFVQIGELVASLSTFTAGTPIVRVEEQDAMLVKMTVNEIDVARLSVGMEALIDVEALPDEDFVGTVTKIAPASTDVGTQQAAGTDPVVRFEVEVLLREISPRLKAGMSARCTIITDSLTDVVLIPSEYLGRRGEERYVLIASNDPEIEPERRTVQVGQEAGGRVHIRDGVAEGEILIQPTFEGPRRQGALQFGGGPDEGDDAGDEE